MTISATKKIGFCLSAISLCGSMSAMMTVNKKFSTTVLSGMKVKLGTALAGVTCAGITVLAKGDNNLEPKQMLLTAGISLCSAIGAYMCLSQLTPEEQLKAYQAEKNNIIQHKIFKKNTNQEAIIDSKITAILSLDDVTQKISALETLAKRKYAKNTGNGESAVLAAVKELCDLEGTIINQRHRLKAIIDSGATADRDLEAERSALKVMKRSIEKIREPLLDKHDDIVNTRANMETAEIEKQKFRYASKIATFVPMFIQPVSALCMVLLNMLFAKLGIE